MKLLVTGGAGFLGSLLVRTLLLSGSRLSGSQLSGSQLSGSQSSGSQSSGSQLSGSLAGEKIERVVVTDLAPPPADLLQDARVEARTGPLLPQCAALAQERFDGVFHLASAVSAECEADFDLGLRSNLDTTRALLDALRAAGNQPRLVFASSAAVFGGDPPALPIPRAVRDDTLPLPQTSYGTQKFVSEQLIADFTRKGFLDGRAVRLLTVTVRPGKPNGAASGFLSGIIREPLAGIPTVCPVPLDAEVALASPERTIAALIAAYEASRERFGGRTALNLPALSVRVGEMLDALEAVAGPAVRALVRIEPDPNIERIVRTWPARFEAQRASALGLSPDPDFLGIVRQYLRDHPAAVKVQAR